MDIHALLVPTFKQMLAGLAAQLEKTAAYARGKQLDFPALLEARLAPDMFPLAMQVAFVCTQARESVSRLTGRALPGPLQGGSSLEELQTQIAAAIAFVDAVAPADFHGSAERNIELVMPNGITFAMSGAQFTRDWAMPQFYFHCVTAYAIQRHAGVPLGKPDFVAHMSGYIR